MVNTFLECLSVFRNMLLSGFLTGSCVLNLGGADGSTYQL